MDREPQSGDTGTDLVNQWHTIGLEWIEGKAVWYVDGVPGKTVTADSVSDKFAELRRRSL